MRTFTQTPAFERVMLAGMNLQLRKCAIGGVDIRGVGFVPPTSIWSTNPPCQGPTDAGTVITASCVLEDGIVQCLMDKSDAHFEPAQLKLFRPKV